MVAHHNAIDVSPQHGSVPNAAGITQRDIANYDRRSGNVDITPKSGCRSQKGIQLLNEAFHRPNIGQVQDRFPARNSE